MSDPVFDLRRERELARPERPSSLSLLRRRDFRILFCAVATSELGDSLNYIALMWLALDRGGALGVVAYGSPTACRRSSSACTAAWQPTAGAAAG